MLVVAVRCYSVRCFASLNMTVLALIPVVSWKTIVMLNEVKHLDV